MSVTITEDGLIRAGRNYGSFETLTKKQIMDLMSAKKEAVEASKKEPGRVFYINLDDEGECTIEAGTFIDDASIHAFKGGSEIPLPNKPAKKSAKEVVEGSGGAPMKIMRGSKQSKKQKVMETTTKKSAKKSAKANGTKKIAKKAKKAAAKKSNGERTVTPVAGTKKNLTIKQIRKEIKEGKVVRKPSGWYFSELWAKAQTDQDRKYEVYVKG